MCDRHAAACAATVEAGGARVAGERVELRRDPAFQALTLLGQVLQRDFGLMLAALTLARLASIYDPPLRRP